MATAVVHCDRCSCFLRSDDCEKCPYTTVAVDAQDGNKLCLTAFNEVLQKVKADPKICEALLLLDKITITY